MTILLLSWYNKMTICDIVYYKILFSLLIISTWYFKLQTCDKIYYHEIDMYQFITCMYGSWKMILLLSKHDNVTIYCLACYVDWSFSTKSSFFKCFFISQNTNILFKVLGHLQLVIDNTKKTQQMCRLVKSFIYFQIKFWYLILIIKVYLSVFH